MIRPAAAPTGLQSAATSVAEVGFVVVPALFDEPELSRMRALIDDVHRRRGSPPLEGFGMAIHPLLDHAPGMLGFFRHPTFVAVAEAILGASVRLAHSGSRLASEASSESIGWHHHYSWPLDGVARRAACERLLVNVYVDGSDDDTGPLIVLPRALQDAMDQPLADTHVDWPGQQVVRCPPGSAVFFDTALWHTAKRGARPGSRRLWGGHLQRLDDPRPHPEDNGAIRTLRLGPADR
jgi:hypothetical protein